MALDRSRYAIGIDIGGTKIAAGVVSDNGDVLYRAQTPTPAHGPRRNVTADRVCELINQLRNQGLSIDAIGIGAAGLVEWPSGVVKWAPHNEYRDLGMAEAVSCKTGLLTVVENDANVAAIGEIRFGHGLHQGTALILTIGTGIGGAVVVDGQLLRGSQGFGGEIGHIPIDVASGIPCACGSVGCLETLVSGTALGRFGREAARREPSGRISALAGGPKSVNGTVVSQAAAEGDPSAVRIFQSMGHWLGIGLASATNILDPAVIIIGGAVGTAANQHLLNSAEQAFEQFTFGRVHRELPKIMIARLGADAGVIGAASLALGHS